MFGKLLKVFGAILLLIVIAGSAMGAYVWYSSNKNSEESEKFARAALQAISTKWEAREVEERYNPKLREKIDQAALQKNLDIIKKGGELKSISNVNGSLLLIQSFEGDPESTAVYRGDIALKNNEYVMRLYLSKLNGQWFIDQIDLCDKSIPDSLANCSL